jgi:ComF family protein
MGVFDLIFPKSCLGCRKEGQYICSDCLAKVRLAKPICPYCEKASIDGFTHIKCAKTFGLDGLTSVWEYEGVVRKAILSLKYKYSTLVGQELSSCFISALLSQYTKYNILNTSVLVPIPLYWHRENVRGFNQSIEVGRVVAAQMGWKFIPDLLMRKKSATPQVELSGDSRRQNLKGVFALNWSCLPHTIPNILLFDDVVTTGSTLHEAAKVLKRAGVEKVWGLTIAR